VNKIEKWYTKVKYILLQKIMVDVTKTFKYSQSWKTVSLIILWLVILITVAFAVYNHFLKNDISDLQVKITEHNKTIEQLKSQKNIHVYSLVEQHREVLWELDKRSHINKYLEHLTAMSSHYNFEARGFQLSGWTILSKVEFNNNELGIAHKKATRFISDYRKDDTSLFDLQFISWVESAQWDIKFPITLSLK